MIDPDMLCIQPIGADYLPLADGLRRLAGRRPVLVSYDVSQGLAFPDAAREKEFRKTLGMKAGALPSDPARALILLDAAGKLLARLPVAREGVQSSPAVDDTMVVLGSGRGLHAYRIAHLNG